jgi:hypothetical protein
LVESDDESEGPLAEEPIVTVSFAAVPVTFPVAAAPAAEVPTAEPPIPEDLLDTAGSNKDDESFMEVDFPTVHEALPLPVDLDFNHDKWLIRQWEENPHIFYGIPSLCSFESQLTAFVGYEIDFFPPTAFAFNNSRDPTTIDNARSVDWYNQDRMMLHQEESLHQTFVAASIHPSPLDLNHFFKKVGPLLAAYRASAESLEEVLHPANRSALFRLLDECWLLLVSLLLFVL